AFLRLVKSGDMTGCVALDDEKPAGWCCVGPYADFPRIERVRALAGSRPPGTWSVVCFFVPARRRGQGIATALLHGAVELATERGARVLEGYPVRSARRPGEPIPAAFAWTGVPEVFERAGFEKSSPAGAPRDVYRRMLVAAPARRGG
ncbi:MAG TPA: GNAT family N-acetyltransferase, partial [Planctomycetota bacterium]|nr:GNAT family N-acetyltransferase [Planctomycetota bacterium]